MTTCAPLYLRSGVVASYAKNAVNVDGVGEREHFPAISSSTGKYTTYARLTNVKLNGIEATKSICSIVQRLIIDGWASERLLRNENDE